MALKLTIMGCGNSLGVPGAGNHWGACDSSNPKNTRLRASALIESNNTTLVIDTGPDFREQSCRHNIQNIDAILYTHFHGDHVNGLDDVRSYTHRQGAPIAAYMNEETRDDIARRFDYTLTTSENGLYKPIITPHVFKESDFGQPHRVGDIDFIPFIQDHGTCTSVGYRFGEVAYSTDLRDLDDDAVEILKGIETWIVDGAAYKRERGIVHAGLPTLKTLNDKIGAKRVIITSMGPGMDYEEVTEELNAYCMESGTSRRAVAWEPAFDGLVLTF